MMVEDEVVMVLLRQGAATMQHTWSLLPGPFTRPSTLRQFVPGRGQNSSTVGCRRPGAPEGKERKARWGGSGGGTWRSARRQGPQARPCRSGGPAHTSLMVKTQTTVGSVRSQKAARRWTARPARPTGTNPWGCLVHLPCPGGAAALSRWSGPTPTFPPCCFGSVKWGLSGAAGSVGKQRGSGYSACSAVICGMDWSGDDVSGRVLRMSMVRAVAEVGGSTELSTRLSPCQDAGT